jgi:hypothetical protein
MASREDGTPKRAANDGVTVVVLAEDVAGLPRCIQSLATQTLSPQQIDAVIVLDSATRESFAAVVAARSQYPELQLRSIALTTWNLGAARQAGVAAARQPYITFVSSSDALQRRFLQALLGTIQHETVAVTRVLDLGPSPVRADTDTFDETSPTNAVRDLERHEVPAALSSDAAKLVPTSWAMLAMDDLASDDTAGVSLWARIFVRQAFGLRLVEGADCAYERHRVARAGMGGAFDTEVTRRIAHLELLEALLDEAVKKETRAVVDKWIRDETTAIGRYLRDHPVDHPRAVQALDRSKLFRLSSNRLNKGLASGLVVSYCFPPYVDTAAIVAAKRVRERAEIVDVVYNAMDRIRRTDITTRRIAGPFLNDEAVVPSPTAFASWASIDSFREMGMAQILSWEKEKGPYSTLYSRAQFAASHFLAAAYKLHQPTTQWTAEFSDPLSRDVQGLERGDLAKEGPFLQQLSEAFRDRGVEPPASRNAFLWCEWTAYVLADELLFTNRNQLEYMKRYCPVSIADLIEQKAVIAPHPTLPPQFYDMVEHNYSFRRDVVNLAYFGNFYSTRGLDDILLAIAGLPVEMRQHTALHVFTSKPDELRHRTAQLDVDENVVVRGYISFLRFLNLTTKFDCLIVNDASTEPDVMNPYLPSKWSDYRGSRSPVWGLVEAGSPLSSMPLDYRSPIGHVSAAQQVLANLVARKVEHRPVFDSEIVDISSM